MSNYRTINSDELAESFKALSNPNRLQIFQRLLSCCEPGTVCSAETVTGFCVGELGENLAVAPSTLSHHIKELQRAGLIKTQRRGKNVECYVDAEKVAFIKEFFSGFVPAVEIENC
jgi:ArsR family transcriptional regulator